MAGLLTNPAIGNAAKHNEINKRDELRMTLNSHTHGY
jgi:hypothetical protein